MALERGASKTDVIVKLALVFFISLLSFSIGTFVGKKFSDNQHKLAQMEPGSHAPADEHGERSVASVHGDMDVKPNDALSEEELAKLADEFVTEEEDATHPTAEAKAPDAHGKPVEHAANNAHEAKPTEEHKVTTHTNSTEADHAPSELANKVAGVDTHATPTKKEVEHSTTEKTVEKVADTHRIPTSLPETGTASATGKYTVQVAAYSSEAEAKTKANELKEKGFSAFYIPVNIRGQNWYRVSVGMFTTQKEATAYRVELMEKAKVSSALVQKIVQ